MATAETGTHLDLRIEGGWRRDRRTQLNPSNCDSIMQTTCRSEPTVVSRSSRSPPRD